MTNILQRPEIKELKLPQFESVRREGKSVDFMICGVQKGGTSALYAYLKDHPEICMSRRKEVHFFDNESFFGNGRPDYSRYHSAFPPLAAQRITGEATPIYIYWENALRRIWRYNHTVKMIAVLRNPIERAFSHWNMERSRNADRLSFWDALQFESERCRKALPFQHRVYSYVDRGFYLEQVRRLWRYFSKDRVLILKNEYLKDQPHSALNEVCDFLGVERFGSVEKTDIHSRKYESSMSERARDYLRDVYEYDIKGLERLLNWDLSAWLA